MSDLFSEKFRDKYYSAKPFPHIISDFYWPKETINEIINEWPEKAEAWNRYFNSKEIKNALSDEIPMGNVTRIFIHLLNAQVFVRGLEALTGIKNLLPDYTLNGGGLHWIKPGGKLGMHVDFNKHPQFGWERRINVIIYLNEDWKEEYGGHLYLGANREIKVLPSCNRMVIFNTDPGTWHGHPFPLTCPDGMSRKSIAMYYYTDGRVDPQQKHTTIFMKGKERAKDIIRDWIPPAIGRIIRK